MSAISSSPAPVKSPKPASPQPVFAPASPNRWKKWAIPAAVLLIAGLGFFVRRGKTQQPAAALTVRTAKVLRGSLDQVLRVTGTTAARSFAAITAPMMRGPDSGRNLVLIKLAGAGTIVKQGDLIAEIDAQPIIDHVDDLSATVAQAEGDINKRKAEQAIEMENLRQSLRQAKADWDKALLDNGAAEIRMPIDKELLQLSIDEAAARYKELQAELSLTEQKQSSEIRILRYTLDRHTRHRDRHKHDLTKFTIHAPLGGLAVMQSIWRSGDFGQIQEGDQVWPGEPFMNIVDTSSMEVQGRINQAESESLRIGQPATIHFDAFPGLQLSGKIRSVGAMGVGGWNENYYIRTIPVVITIQGSDSRIIPDLSASADVVLSHQENALIAPLESVVSEGGRQVVYAKRDSRFLPRAVQLGRRNHTQVEIVAGLQAGDEVALARPTALP